MGRNQENTTPTSIRLDRDLLEKIKRDAKINGRSITKEIEQIIIKYYSIKGDS